MDVRQWRMAPTGVWNALDWRPGRGLRRPGQILSQVFKSSTRLDTDPFPLLLTTIIPPPQRPSSSSSSFP